MSPKTQIVERRNPETQYWSQYCSCKDISDNLWLLANYLDTGSKILQLVKNRKLPLLEHFFPTDEMSILYSPNTLLKVTHAFGQPWYIAFGCCTMTKAFEVWRLCAQIQHVHRWQGGESCSASKLWDRKSIFNSFHRSTCYDVFSVVLSIWSFERRQRRATRELCHAQRSKVNFQILKLLF